MNCTFEIDRESPITRRFSIRVETTIERPIRAVEAQYDGFQLDRDELPASVTTFERVYRKDQGSSNGKHTLLITAELADGTSESFVRIWQE